MANHQHDWYLSATDFGNDIKAMCANDECQNQPMTRLEIEIQLDHYDELLLSCKVALEALMELRNTQPAIPWGYRGTKALGLLQNIIMKANADIPSV